MKISIKQLSAAYGIDRSGVLRYLKKKGIPLPPRQQMPDSGNQRTYAWDQADAEALIELRKSEGFTVGEGL